MFRILPAWFGHLFTPKEPRHPWRVYRFHGGGELLSPPMTEAEACEWVSIRIKGEIAYIDRECGFIFYRPKE